ncbi:MAG TPA: hypothetical protein VHE79_09175, partial [Spirochaetia bacterium]
MKEIDYRGESVPIHPPHTTDRFADVRRSFDAPQPRSEGDLPVGFVDEGDFEAFGITRHDPDDDTEPDDEDAPSEPPPKKRRRRRSRDREATGWARVEEFERLSRAYYEDDLKGIRVRK